MKRCPSSAQNELNECMSSLDQSPEKGFIESHPPPFSEKNHPTRNRHRYKFQTTFGGRGQFPFSGPSNPHTKFPGIQETRFVRSSRRPMKCDAK
ncbi:hypothetical protein JTE90_019236 [Oedothorax gibbosus]|uniref:Uncharacterized protein n=1 Tax=Oedothorax gibbosus TaxID=931172 RepID=A0AAV6URR9_9ARAC|nr:hypothetical protein JTE90_019236 [Oedothorax gibbosus]